MDNDIINIYIKESENPKDTTLLFGQFIEHALDCIEGGISDFNNINSDENGIRKDVVEKIIPLQPSIIRFPGGTIMCQYHWEDAIGPQSKRIWRKNLIWGGELNPSFGTAEFILLCRKVGAEPMICINMESGTPEEAANWVEYCNSDGNSYYAELRRSHGFQEPFHVKYWCIGNESYSPYDMGIHHNVHLYNQDAMEYMKRMKLTDPTIKTIIVGCDDENWNKTVLDALHEVTDYFSIHHYSSTNAQNPYEPFYGECALSHTVDKISSLIDSYPEKVTDFNRWYRFPAREQKIQIAVDEWNIWDFKEDATYGLRPTYCWRDALWVASMLNLFINKPSIGLANMAQLVNVLAPIRTSENNVWYQTIAYPLISYRKYMTGNSLSIQISSNAVIPEAENIEAISVSAVKQEDKIFVAIVNRDARHSYAVNLFNEQYPSKIDTIFSLKANSFEDISNMDYNCVQICEEKVQSNTLNCAPGSIYFLQII